MQENAIFKHNQRHWCTIGAMLGCAYIKHINNCRFSTFFNKTLLRLVTWELKKLKQVFEKETRFQMTDEHEKRLEQTISLFLHTIVLNIQNNVVPMSDVMNDDT